MKIIVAIRLMATRLLYQKLAELTIDLKEHKR